MMVSLGLFSNMTRVVGREQKPAERLLEGRIASLTVARRIRNCQGFVAPSFREFLGQPTDALMLRDGVLGKTVHINVVDGILGETYFSPDYDPKFPDNFKPIKRVRLTPVASFQVTSGGISQPTRIIVDITLPDKRSVRAVTNLREGI
jgi:hypothetical protein